MSKVIWALFLAFAMLQPAWSADLTVNGRAVLKRSHVYVHHQRVTLTSAVAVIEVVYPRSLYAINDRLLRMTRYACWAWTPDNRLRLVASEWPGQCFSTSYPESAIRNVRFVEYRS
jgi:hypothetical protein